MWVRSYLHSRAVAPHAVTLESSRKFFCSIWTSHWFVCSIPIVKCYTVIQWEREFWCLCFFWYWSGWTVRGSHVLLRCRGPCRGWWLGGSLCGIWRRSDPIRIQIGWSEKSYLEWFWSLCLLWLRLPIVYRWTCSKQSFSKTRISWAWINIKNLDNLRLPVTVAGLFLAQKSGLDTRCMTRSYAALKFLNCFSGRLPWDLQRREWPERRFIESLLFLNELFSNEVMLLRSETDLAEGGLLFARKQRVFMLLPGCNVCFMSGGQSCSFALRKASVMLCD